MKPQVAAINTHPIQHFAVIRALRERIGPVLPARTKLVVADLLCNRLTGAALNALFGHRIRNNGVLVDTSSPYVSATISAMLFWGLYESAEQRFVHELMLQDRDVVELGSSIGAVSSHIARRLGPGRRLIAVEANPHLADVTRANLRLNAPDRAWTVVNAAIAYGTERVRFLLGESSLTSQLADLAAPRSKGTVCEVPAIALSKLLEIESVRDYVLVSDIEGAEAALLEHDPQAFTTCSQIIIELHATTVRNVSVSTDDLCKMIRDLGFRETAHHGCVFVFSR